jgi:hypothetical protein
MGGVEEADITLSTSCASCLTGRNPMETENSLDGLNTDIDYLATACATEMAACEGSQTCLTYMELLRKLHV